MGRVVRGGLVGYVAAYVMLTFLNAAWSVRCYTCTQAEHNALVWDAVDWFFGLRVTGYLVLIVLAWAVVVLVGACVAVLVASFVNWRSPAEQARRWEML